MDFLLIHRADSGVSVMQLPTDSVPSEELTSWEQTADPSWLPVQATHRVSDPVLPSRRWRNAWRLQGDQVSVDLSAARLLRQAELLSERDRFIAALGPLIDAAQDAGDLVEEARLRQRRREATDLASTLAARLETIGTLEELAAYEPPELRDPS